MACAVYRVRYGINSTTEVKFGCTSHNMQHWDCEFYTLLGIHGSMLDFTRTSPQTKSTTLMNIFHIRKNVPLDKLLKTSPAD